MAMGMLVCKYLWGAWVAVWLLWGLRGKRTQQRESVSSRLSYTVLNLAAFWLMFMDDIPQPWGDIRQPWLPTRLYPPNLWTDSLGIALTAAGLAFALWARA